MAKKRIGHHFLAQLGKKRLRPGGIKATNWLMQQGDFNSDKHVLEVACNMGTTLIEVVKTYNCQMTGVDIDKKALKVAQKNIDKASLNSKVSLKQANALKLPFPDETFDIVINEAMLTMLSNSAKKKAIKEYQRVLKKGGKLLTHDIALFEDDDLQKQNLSSTINMIVSPLTVTAWKNEFEEAGFSKISQKTGNMSLMSPAGLLRDEGLLRTIMIVKNGLKVENREQFVNMFKFFAKEKHKMQYIVTCAEK